MINSGKKEIGSEELKRIQLEMLKDVHEFCVSHELNYYLTYGTLLGAVRHKGFIPWDDDIDIVMPRHDFEVLMKSYNKNKRSNNTYFLNNSIDKRYYLPSAKIINTDTDLLEEINTNFHIGVYIDVFVLDEMSNNEKDSVRLLNLIKKYGLMLELKNLSIGGRNSIIKKIIVLMGRLVLKTVTRSYLINKINKLSQKYNHNSKSKFVANLFPATYGSKEIMPCEWWNSKVEIDFEGSTFYAPKEYDKILTRLYGDYMQYPPVEKRISHHGFKAYWK